MECRYLFCPFFIAAKATDYSLVYEGFCRINGKKMYAYDKCPYVR